LINLNSACNRTDGDVREFFRSAYDGDLAKVRLLLNRNPSLVSSRNKESYTALHYAAYYGFMEIAELLLASHADVNAKTQTGDTALHYAATYGYKDITELLLLNKADVNARDHIGRTPLYDAACAGRVEEVQI
jgi:ankyrin repeat protein